MQRTHTLYFVFAVFVAASVGACGPQPEPQQASVIPDLTSNPAASQQDGPDEQGVPAGLNAPRRSLCGIQLGETIPAGIEYSKVEEATEDKPITVYEFDTCEDGVRLTAELESGKVSRLDLEGVGACAPDIACVGESYAEILSRFPKARKVATLIEGKTLALLVDDKTVVRFDAEQFDDSCFDQANDEANKCSASFLDRKVTSITMI
jgi:hypothetical protein